MARGAAASDGRDLPRRAAAQVAAAFVLLWYLDLLAVPAAYACALGPWVLDVGPAAVRFDLAEPGLYPCAVSLAPEDVLTVADPARRRQQARRATSSTPGGSWPATTPG